MGRKSFRLIGRAPYLHALVDKDAVGYSSGPKATKIVEDRSIAESDDVNACA